MARPTAKLVFAFENTARRLRDGSDYKWSSYANCNCGNLAQVLTEQSAEVIQKAAFNQTGDWGQQARDYCPTSGLHIDWILDQMVEAGLHVSDFRHIERLTQPDVLKAIQADSALKEQLPLHHAKRDDTELFFGVWARLLEERLPEAERLRLVEMRNQPSFRAA